MHEHHQPTNPAFPQRVPLRDHILIFHNRITILDHLINYKASDLEHE